MATLITYASKHGSTAGIAERIAETLRQRGQEATVRPVSAVTNLQQYEAFVIGSAVYMVSWMQEATEFVRRNRALLAERPVWLFSSGPTGDATLPEPKQIAEFQAAIRPRDHRVFAGALDRQQLSFSERVIVKAVKAATGDFRDWEDIDAWAENIAHTLAQAATLGQPG
jgi:menaquinone-dependent protoporphyrinogen oxidase